MTDLPRLTFRKVTILLWLDAGLGYKQIAAKLDVHLNTVHLHVKEIAAKLPHRPGLSPRDLVLLYCERLLVKNADVVAQVRSSNKAA